VVTVQVGPAIRGRSRRRARVGDADGAGLELTGVAAEAGTRDCLARIVQCVREARPR